MRHILAALVLLSAPMAFTPLEWKDLPSGHMPRAVESVSVTRLPGGRTRVVVGRWVRGRWTETASLVAAGDSAHAGSCTTTTNDADPAQLAGCSITAGELLFIVADGNVSNQVEPVFTFTTTQSDVFLDSGTAVGLGSVHRRRGTVPTSVVSKLTVAVVCSAVGGSTTFDVDADAAGATGNVTFNTFNVIRFTRDTIPSTGCMTDSDTGSSPNNGSDAAASPATSKSFTPAGAAALLVGAITNNNTNVAPNNGETEHVETGSTHNLAVQSHRVTGASTMSWQWTATNRWWMAVLEFEEGGAAPSNLPLSNPLRGGGWFFPMVAR